MKRKVENRSLHQHTDVRVMSNVTVFLGTPKGEVTHTTGVLPEPPRKNKIASDVWQTKS